MLKQWCQNQDISEIDIEEKYKTWVANLRTDRYVTVMSLLKYIEIGYEMLRFSDLHRSYEVVPPLATTALDVPGDRVSVGETLRKKQ